MHDFKQYIIKNYLINNTTMPVIEVTLINHDYIQ